MKNSFPAGWSDLTFSDWLSLIGLLVGLFGVAVAVWQTSRITNLKKIVNDKVKGLYKHSKDLLDITKKGKSYERIAERARAIRSEIVRLDLANNNLNKKKINKREKNKVLTPAEADEYRSLSSN